MYVDCFRSTVRPQFSVAISALRKALATRARYDSLMKIAHISDIHAGYASGRLLNSEQVNIREQDGYDALKEIVDDVISCEPDAAVFAGDTMHVHNPSIRAMIEVKAQLRRLADAGIACYLLAGNHDTNDVKADIAASRIFHDPDRKIFSHAEPYVLHELADGVHLHMVSHHTYMDQQATMGEIQPVDNAINVFTTHGSVIDPLLKEKLHAEQSPREIVIPDALLNDYDWDYVMLGHIHERGWVGSSDRKTDTLGMKVYYNGSSIRRGFSDKEVPLGRGWTLWTIDSDGEFHAEPRVINQRTQRDFSIVEAKDATPAAITEQIIEHLRSSQYEGEFDAAQAPILRQRITGLTPAKHAALDLRAIAHESRHALQWSMKIIAAELADDEGDEKTIDTTEMTKNMDVMSVYDSWIDESKSYDEVTEEMRSKVRKSARKYLKKGLEVTLNDEEA